MLKVGTKAPNFSLPSAHGNNVSLYDFIGKSNQYGDIEDLRAQSAYSAFSSNLSPVCAGYSKASEILFNNIGIKSLLIHGESEYALFLGIPHAWNIVSIDESFYLYDVTMSSNAQTEQLFYHCQESFLQRC